MKKLLTILLVIGTAINTFAQFKLSGNIANTTKPDTFFINIPFIYGYYHDNDVAIPVDAKGNFNITLNVLQQKFGNIRFDNKAVYLLLTPGKSLVMNYHPAHSSVTFNGTAGPENRILDQLDLNGIPFFSKDNDNNPYAKLTFPQLQLQVIKPWLATRDKNTALVNASSLTTNDKALLIQEIKGNAITQLNNFARINLNIDRQQRSKLILDIYKDVKLTPAILPAGPLYYWLVDSYIGYYETLAFADVTPEKVSEPSTYLKYYNLTIDSGTKIATQKGKAYLSWMLVKDNFPENIAESWLAQAVFTKCSTKDLPQAVNLIDELKARYPKSKYLPFLNQWVTMLKQLLVENMNNQDIVIADGYEKTTSIYEIISKLKGKVVYLDVWGTWCGPCKDELRYNPQLKQQFEDKDVAFVYLDMDEDIQDSQWRDFIKVNGMTGLHLRKSRAGMEQFWNELRPKKEDERYYPMYFIFDKMVSLYRQMPNAQVTKPCFTNR
jgi:thiol-disulfide isomerase/thioredoxin